MKTHPYYFSLEKRLFDVGLAVTLLVILSPLLIVIGLLVWLTSGSPVLFTQRRMGLGGRGFVMYKFRVMKRNAPMIRHQYRHLNQAPAPMFKIHNDPRFESAGRFLSHTGLDELPQLWNILRGEMSFIGPRPLPLKEAQALPNNWRAFRERVKPGIFSEWTTQLGRHQSLSIWEKREKQTVSQGGWRYELYLIGKTLRNTFLQPKE